MDKEELIKFIEWLDEYLEVTPEILYVRNRLTTVQNYLDEQEGIKEFARLKKEYVISPEELEIYKNQSKND